MNPDDENNTLNGDDRRLIEDSINESTPVIPEENSRQETKDNVDAYGDEYGGYKRGINFELTQDKLNAVTQLQACNYRTPPTKIAELLKVVFEGCGTQEGWWLSVAQLWNPRAICRVIAVLNKMHSSGWTTFRNPAQFFTFLIKKRKRRRSLPITMAPVNGKFRRPRGGDER